MCCVLLDPVYQAADNARERHTHTGTPLMGASARLQPRESDLPGWWEGGGVREGYWRGGGGGVGG